MTITEYEDALPLFDAVARQLSRRYPPIERDDIRQHLAAYTWRYRERILLYEDKFIEFELYRQGGSYCKKERARLLDLDDHYHYVPDDVAKALAVFFSLKDWHKFRGTVDDVTLPSGQVIYASDRMGGIVMLADMRRVWDHLSLKAQQALYMCYGLGYEASEYAFHADIDEAAAAKRRERALAELTRELNYAAKIEGKKRDRWAEGPGTRQAMTNERAQHEVNTGYDG